MLNERARFLPSELNPGCLSGHCHPKLLKSAELFDFCVADRLELLGLGVTDRLCHLILHNGIDHDRIVCPERGLVACLALDRVVSVANFITATDDVRVVFGEAIPSAIHWSRLSPKSARLMLRK